MDKYTTQTLIDKEKDLKPEEQKEKTKITLSNDAFAICDFIEQLINKAEQLRISSIIRR